MFLREAWLSPGLSELLIIDDVLILWFFERVNRIMYLLTAWIE